MKSGYSLLLGEYVDAESVGYKDCKSFQIVCPACKEPVFKVERTIPQSLHYLAHYEASKAFEAECELRVGRISEQDKKRENILSRGQKLEYFLSVLRSAIIESEFSGHIDEASAEIKRMMSKAPGFQMYANLIYTGLLVAGPRPRSLWSLYLDDYASKFTQKNGYEAYNGFSLEIQKRITLDVFEHIQTPNARGNFCFLFAAATISYYRILHVFGMNNNLSSELQEIEYLLPLISRCSKRDAETILIGLQRKSINAPDGNGIISLRTLLDEELIKFMMICLFRLPYFEMLTAVQGLNYEKCG